MTNAQLQKMADENARAWLDSNTDTNGLSDSNREYVETLKGPKKSSNTFEFIDQAQTKSKVTADDFSEADLAELARKDPHGFGVKWHEAKREEIMLAFRKATPSYLATSGNCDAMLNHIRKYQIQDDGLPEDDIIPVAYDQGYWTVENLRGVFQVLARQGKMRMPKNQPKPLTRDEQLRVISYIRNDDYKGAIEAYLNLSYGGSLPEGSGTTRDFLLSHADDAAKALWFVFQFAHDSDISPDEFKAFKKAHAHIPLPTFPTLEAAWLNWRERGLFQTQQTQPQSQPQQIPEPTPADPNKMSDEELDAAIVAERKNYRQNH
jgi:hypothetical protein